MSVLSRSRSVIRDVWSIFGIGLLGLLLVDQALREVVPRVPLNPGPPRHEADAYGDAEWVQAYYEEHGRSTTHWEPYVYWRRDPAAGDFVRIDERGLRYTWNPEPTGARRRIFVFGGSTVWGTGARDEHTIPSELSRQLNEGGIATEVVNFGESGYVSTQGLIALMRELQAGNVPDQVVMYDGVNDVVSAYQNGVAGLPQGESYRRMEFNLRKDKGGLVLALSRRVLKGVERLRRWGFAKPWQPPADPDRLAAEIARFYSGTLKLASALSREFGFGLRLYWQPVVYSKPTRSGFESLVSESSPEQGRLFGLTETAIAASPEIVGDPRFRDLSRLFDAVPGPLFVDFCHLSEAGNALVAEAIAADVVADLSALPR